LNALDFNPKANQDILPIVEHLETILDCMILQGFQSNLPSTTLQVDHSPLIKGTSPGKTAQSRKVLGDND